MQSARSARLFCHLKLPKLLRCQSIPSRSYLVAFASRVKPMVVKWRGL